MADFWRRLTWWQGILAAMLLLAFLFVVAVAFNLAIGIEAT
jgi:hypothetical protein